MGIRVDRPAGTMRVCLCVLSCLNESFVACVAGFRLWILVCGHNFTMSSGNEKVRENPE